MKIRSKTEKLTVSGMLIAVGLILPFATSHAIGIPGSTILPMHIPVFICGLLCGPLCGGIVGLVLPLLNSILTSMPALYPSMPLMAAELCVYGAVSGALYHKTSLGKRRIGVYIALLSAMICGRVAYGLAFQALLAISGELKALTVWGALVTGIPGIIIQILLVPGVVFAVEGIMHKGENNALASAKNLILREKATCVVIKKGKIINIESQKGIKPVVSMYEQGLLKDAIIVDKLIGRAAAMIITLGGASACYAFTASKGAMEYLKKHNISAECEVCTDYIINRTGDGICPMEEAVKDIEDPVEALAAIKIKMDELRAKSDEIKL